MTSEAIIDDTSRAREAVDDRLRRFPGHPLFAYAERDIARVEQRIASGVPADRAFYDSLNVGLMCARELEAADMPFCDAVYAMLEAVRREASG